MENEQQKTYTARFYELLKASKAPKITEYDKSGVIIFDEHSDDVRKVFTTDKYFTELLNMSFAEFTLSTRTISLFLWPDKDNPLTVYIHPIENSAHGESMTCFIQEKNLDINNLKQFLHKYLTNKEFKIEQIQDNRENYVFVPRTNL